MNNIIENNFEEILKLIQEARFNALKTVNKELMNLYWNIGHYITDKVDSEIFSEYEGTLKEILVKEGEEVSVGTPICTMEVDDSIEVSTVTLSAKRSEAVEVSNKDFSTPLHSAQNDKTQLTPRN